MYEYFTVTSCGALCGVVLVYATWFWKSRNNAKATPVPLPENERRLHEITGILILLFVVIYLASLRVVGL